MISDCIFFQAKFRWTSQCNIYAVLTHHLMFLFCAGTVDFSDFLTMMTVKMSEKDSKEEILKAFRLFDDDETGKISFKNLKRVAKELGENLTDEELQASGVLHIMYILYFVSSCLTFYGVLLHVLSDRVKN